MLAARALAGAAIQVTLVDRENHHLFQPLLYQVATASLAPGSIAVPIRSVLAKQKNARVYLGEARGVDKARRCLLLADGNELLYDYLVVAVGARTNYFGNDQWAQASFGLKDLRDAIAVREAVLLAFERAELEAHPERRRALLTFAVIGGGPTGVEMAGAISELGRQVLARDFRRVAPQDIRVVLIEMADRVLTPFDPGLSEAAGQQLRELGVDLWLGKRVSDITAGQVEVTPREGGEKETLPASVVVWASGVRPAPFVDALGVEQARDGRVVVDEHCAAVGHPEIFVVGDCAAFRPSGDEEALPAQAPVAMQQGRHVARLIREELGGRPRAPFQYVDKGIMATIGRSRAVTERGALKLSGLLAWLAWCFVHVLYLIGFRNRLIVMFNWFWSYLTFKRGARLITRRGVGTEDSTGSPPDIEGEDLSPPTGSSEGDQRSRSR